MKVNFLEVGHQNRNVGSDIISHKKTIDERIQEPRSALEHEKLKHFEHCLNAFSDESELVNNAG